LVTLTIVIVGNLNGIFKPCTLVLFRTFTSFVQEFVRMLNLEKLFKLDFLYQLNLTPLFSETFAMIIEGMVKCNHMSGNERWALCTSFFCIGNQYLSMES